MMDARRVTTMCSIADASRCDAEGVADALCHLVIGDAIRDWIIDHPNRCRLSVRRADLGARSDEASARSCDAFLAATEPLSESR